MDLQPSTIQLRIVPVESLILHEEDDPFRVEALTRSLARDQRLKNPIIVAQCDEAHIVLDGATRTSALRALGVRDALVQIVHYFSERVGLGVWNHVIERFSSDRLLAEMAPVDQWDVSEIETGTLEKELESRKLIAGICLPDGRELSVRCDGDIHFQANQLCKLVGLYRGKAVVHRVSAVDMPALNNDYPEMSAVICFPPFTPSEIVQVATNREKVPMGITRHVIQGRVLGFGAPLQMLTGAQELSEKNEWLANQLRRRLRANKIRLYREPVFLFEE